MRVRIPGMEAGSDVHDVPRHVVPAGTVVGERFHIRCSLDPDAFAVEPALEGERQCQ